MSQENVEVVRRVIAALGAGDREDVLRYFDPEVVVDASRHGLNPATYVGVNGLRRMVAAADAVWDEIRRTKVSPRTKRRRLLPRGSLAWG